MRIGCCAHCLVRQSVWVLQEADAKTRLDMQEIFEGNTCEKKMSRGRERLGEPSDCDEDLTTSEGERGGRKVGWQRLRLQCGSKRSQQGCRGGPEPTSSITWSSVSQEHICLGPLLCLVIGWEEPIRSLTWSWGCQSVILSVVVWVRGTFSWIPHAARQMWPPGIS